MEEEWVEFEALERIERIVIGGKDGEVIFAGPWNRGDHGFVPRRIGEILAKHWKIKPIRGGSLENIMNASGPPSKPIDVWFCRWCFNPVEEERPQRPKVCPNPNCTHKAGPFVPLTGPWIYFDQGRFLAKEVADEVLKTTAIRTHIQSGIMYRFNGGYYDTQGEQVTCAEVRRLLEGICTEHMVKEVVAQIRETTYVQPDFFEPPVNLINLKNGILDINTGELKPHTPELGFLNQLPVEYNPSADCPQIKEFLSQVAREEDIPVLQEWCGYCLLRDYRFHKALFLVGTGSNGKSTFLRLLTTFLGKENVAATSLKDLCENRFASAELYGKLACIHADLPPEPLRYTGKFKMLVGEDLIEAEFKFRNRFRFYNYAKLTYSGNELPKVTDKTYAFWSRWIVIEFPNVFPEGKANPQILEKLTTHQELSGMLNWALEGLKRLLKNGGFSFTKSMDEVKREWLLMADPLQVFVDECVAHDPSYFVTKDDFYAAYQDWCEENEVTPEVKNVVGARLPTLIKTKAFRPRTENGRPHSWKWIRLREPYERYNKLMSSEIQAEVVSI